MLTYSFQRNSPGVKLSLIFISFSVHLLTLKRILLPLQIKDLTNNYELIATTNKFGHGVSYSVLQELLTEVAYNKTENVKEDEVALPDICINEKFTVLVEDNIDRLEERLSGKLVNRDSSHTRYFSYTNVKSEKVFIIFSFFEFWIGALCYRSPY